MWHSNEVLSEKAGRARLSISGGVMAAARACIKGLSVPQLLCPLLIRGPPVVIAPYLLAGVASPFLRPHRFRRASEVFWRLRGLYKRAAGVRAFPGAVCELCCRDYGRSARRIRGQKLRYASPGSIHHSNLTQYERLARRDTAWGLPTLSADHGPLILCFLASFLLRVLRLRWSIFSLFLSPNKREGKTIIIELWTLLVSRTRKHH